MSKEPIKKLDWANRKSATRSVVTTQVVLDVLADAFVLDRNATEELVKRWVTCNEELAAHPLIQVRSLAGNNFVGFLGFLNGILAASGQPKVAAKFDDAGRLIGFQEYASRTSDCNVPPNGWRCTRSAGHEGPCAALPIESENNE
jgi:hypothetical protein